MTLTSTLFKGSRIKDGIWTCNKAGGGARVAGMASLSINVIVLLIRHWESCSCIMRVPQGEQSFLTPTDLYIWSPHADKEELSLSNWTVAQHLWVTILYGGGEEQKDTAPFIYTVYSYVTLSLIISECLGCWGVGVRQRGAGWRAGLD